jgi:hypothetical protein
MRSMFALRLTAQSLVTYKLTSNTLVAGGATKPPPAIWLFKHRAETSGPNTCSPLNYFLNKVVIV